MNIPTKPELTFRDFSTAQEVRWCPGCGDFAVLKAVQKLLPKLAVEKENQVFISGIGCSSRFPYYMETYGFHTIHGRAPAIATGVKLANPKLDVWMITGDGDGLSIGANHMVHVLRRNVDLQILLFNNEVYGLTKGQYSPTSPPKTISGSTPNGSVDRPLSPCALALGAGARFVARSIDTDIKHLSHVLEQAYRHEGAAFSEILQNCPVYNDGFFDQLKDKKVAADNRIMLEHGQPLIFGVNSDKGLVLNSRKLSLEVAELGQDGIDENSILVHDQCNRELASLLASLKAPEFPVAFGVLYNDPASSFVTDVYQQRDSLRAGKPAADIQSLLHGAPTWTVET